MPCTENPTRCMHGDRVRSHGCRLDRFGVDVLEQLETTATVRCLEHGDVSVAAVEADRRVSPLSTDRVPAHDDQAEVIEECYRGVEVTTAIPTFSNLMGTQRTVELQRLHHVQDLHPPVRAVLEACPKSAMRNHSVQESCRLEAA
jgi:hypothetical protein